MLTGQCSACLSQLLGRQKSEQHSGTLSKSLHQVAHPWVLLNRRSSVGHKIGRARAHEMKQPLLLQGIPPFLPQVSLLPFYDHMLK